MMLIIGLGNPGGEFRGTRHNVGREIVEAAGKRLGLGDFRFEKKWNARVVEGTIGKERVALLLPDTMMNRSGASVGPAARYFKVKSKSIFVAHDDADIALGSAKLSFGKNSAGHKGVESLMRALKTKEFWRFRIGIAGKRDVPADALVLKKFTAAEAKPAKKIFSKTIRALEQAILEGPEKTMNGYNDNA